jgi:hypothetical protein
MERRDQAPPADARTRQAAAAAYTHATMRAAAMQDKRSRSSASAGGSLGSFVASRTHLQHKKIIGCAAKKITVHEQKNMDHSYSSLSIDLLAACSEKKTKLSIMEIQ